MTGNEDNHLLIREIVCLFIRLNADFFEGFTADLKEDLDLQGYLQWVAKATKDAGQLEIVAFSWAFQIVCEYPI